MADLMLDAAFPPLPAQWLNDMDSIGAAGAFIYVWGPITNYTVQHVTYARSRSKTVLPIIVPGNQPGDPRSMIATLGSYGFTDGPVLFDFESGSLPTNQWWNDTKSVLESEGFVPDRYGNVSVLAGYSPGETGDWVASWIETGTIATIPQLTTGYGALQFANDVPINGNTYDVSIIDMEMFVPMTSSERIDISRALIRLAYLSGGDREPATQDDITNWLGIMNSQGFENGVALIADSAEFSGDESTIAKMRADYLAGKLGGATGTFASSTHTHSIPPTGQPQ